MKGAQYDIAVVGGGHNGLVAACYLARAGRSVVVLERNAEIGGATRSKALFDGVEARLSVYSYLVSLFPQKIVDDLGLRVEFRSRPTASWTPAIGADGARRELLLRNGDPAGNREAFRRLTGGEADYRGYQRLNAMAAQLASAAWPSLTQPLVSRGEMERRLGAEGREAWRSLVEEPLGEAIEASIGDDLVRGLVFTDARIGIPTHPHDASLIQNRCFLYHLIGGGTGEWRVPVGGMGALVDELVRVALATGRVTFVTHARATAIHPGRRAANVSVETDRGEIEIEAGTVLCNASADVLARLLGEEGNAGEGVEGTAFKVNMLLERLPKLRSSRVAATEAFAGTVHIDEGYEQMRDAYQQGMAGQLPEIPPGEIYCHTLTDPSILGSALRQRGFHTLTLFGLDMPYRLFEGGNEAARAEVLERYLAGIDRHLEEPIASCLATDAAGAPCIEAMSAVDLERELALPKGNIFHGDLSWPFAESAEEEGTWGVETPHPNILMCGSSARRGGAVSGIPGHNAAMEVLGMA